MPNDPDLQRTNFDYLYPNEASSITLDKTEAYIMTSMLQV